MLWVFRYSCLSRTKVCFVRIFASDFRFGFSEVYFSFGNTQAESLDRVHKWVGVGGASGASVAALVRVSAQFGLSAMIFIDIPRP